MAEYLEVRKKLGNSPKFESKSDQYLIRKAINERWPISPEIREKIVVETTDMLDSPDGKLRLTAARTLVQIDALNLKEKELKIKSQPRAVIHTNMSMEDLEKRIKELHAELGMLYPAPALAALEARKEEEEEEEEE